MSVASELLIILGLIIANGIFAMAEIAVVSSRKTRLEQQAGEGSAGARAALGLATSPGAFLSTIQIGITMIGVVTGAVGGATVAEQLGAWLGTAPALAPYSEAIGVVVVVVVITYLSLVVGELAPKRIALASPETIASRLAGPMRRLSQLAGPAVRLLDWSTGTLLRAVGWTAGKESPVTEEEIGVLVEQATDAGVFEEAEGEMMESVLRLGDRVVASAMTPRPDVVWLDPSDPIETTLQRIKNGGHSRYPVARDDLDRIVGIVETTDLLYRCLSGEPFDLAASTQTAEIVPETMPLLDLLRSSREARAGMVLVADEYGGILGIVTEADLFYALVGDTRLPIESGDRDAVQRDDGSWLLSGRLSVEDMQRILEVDDLPDDEQGRYHTLAGFVLTRLGHIPETAESFDWSEHRFEIVDMDGHRVDKVLVTPLPRNIYEMSDPT